MEDDMEDNTIGQVLPGQNWVELHGCFTPVELEKIIEEIKEQYGKAINDNTELPNS